MFGWRTVIGCSLQLFLVARATAFNFAFPAATNVPPSLKFIATADFNGDGRTDVVVSSPDSAKITVLLGTADGVLTPVTACSFAGSLGAIAAGDLNGDGRPDLAVADELSQGVVVMINNGDATFAPQFQRTIDSHPVAVAIADFDGGDGNDLAVADRVGNRELVLTNNGQAQPSFRLAGDYSTGPGPQEILAVDFNGDTIPDIVTLNLGADEKDVTVLLFDRISQGLPVFRALPSVRAGENPRNMITGDFNGDSIRDVAVLDLPSGSPGGQVEFLVGDGRGFLARSRPLDLACPFFAGVRGCSARALTAGDFNADGKTDLAVTQVDPRFAAAGDILTIYVGLGDGVYAPGPVFRTDPAPDSMAVADIAGASPPDPSRSDGLPDIIVGSSVLNRVQVYFNRTTGDAQGDRLPGQRCDDPTGAQCTTELCIDGFCCRIQCLANELCNVPGVEGFCIPIGGDTQLGYPCGSDADCLSELCTDGVCCKVESCPRGEFCGGANGECIAGTPSPTPSAASGTPTPTPCVNADSCIGSQCRPPCAGDCNLDGHVSVEELVIGVKILLKEPDAPSCQGGQDVSQLLQAIDEALNGCP